MKITVIMYHYVRELRFTKYPKIKALLASEFKEQVSYLQKYYEFVTITDCIDVVYNKSRAFPSNAALLTFDDGFIDHFTTVFPILEEREIQGCFFPAAKTIEESTVLDVHKIQFILASLPNSSEIVDNIFKYLNHYKRNRALTP